LDFEKKRKKRIRELWSSNNDDNDDDADKSRDVSIKVVSVMLIIEREGGTCILMSQITTDCHVRRTLAPSSVGINSDTLCWRDVQTTINSYVTTGRLSLYFDCC